MQVGLIVIDSGGIGEAPDAAEYGDLGANTIGHALSAVGGEDLPYLAEMGLGRLLSLSGTRERSMNGAAAKVRTTARGKDTLAGHWEMMGLLVTEPFRTFPDGFPEAIVHQLEEAFGCPLLGNRAASGTEIMAELGTKHLQTGYPIVYTSADSVLQIACHEEVVPLEKLYAWCEAARAIMQGPQLVGRIIARPFVGAPGHFVRTTHRHDYAVVPPRATMVDQLQAAGIETVAIGKIGDIFSGKGFDRHIPTKSNLDGLQEMAKVLQSPGFDRFVFTNLVEFDSHYGHRRDAPGYVKALKQLDDALPSLWDSLGDEDQLWITADHGCDPTYRGSDHTREWVPWLAWGKRLRPVVGEPRLTLQDIAATLGGLFQVTAIGAGHPWNQLLREDEK